MSTLCGYDELHPAFRVTFQVAGETIEAFRKSLPEGGEQVPDFRWGLFFHLLVIGACNLHT